MPGTLLGPPLATWVQPTQVLGSVLSGSREMETPGGLTRPPAAGCAEAWPNRAMAPAAIPSMETIVKARLGARLK